MNDILRGKNCFITGATGALGRSLASQLYERGCNLFLTSRSYDKLKSLSLELEHHHSRVSFEPFDLNDFEKIDDFIRRVNDRFNIDVLINSAGVFTIKNIEGVSKGDLDTHINVNVKAPYIFCKSFCNNMKQNRWGKIVNVGSSSSYSGFKNGTLYCTTKHAILGLSRALYEELKEYNIQVICVSPGSMQSEMAKASVDQDFSTFLLPLDVAAQIVNALSMENNMVCNEIRLNRFVIR